MRVLVEAEVRERALQIRAAIRHESAETKFCQGCRAIEALESLVDEVVAQREVVAAADRLRARVEELDGKAWDFGRLNEAATYDDARAKYAAAVAVPEAEETPQ